MAKLKKVSEEEKKKDSNSHEGLMAAIRAGKTLKGTGSKKEDGSINDAALQEKQTAIKRSNSEPGVKEILQSSKTFQGVRSANSDDEGIGQGRMGSSSRAGI